MKINILFKSVFLIMFLMAITMKAQVVVAEFNNWTAKYAVGNYTQVSTAGVWNMTRASVYPAGSASISLNGYVELAISKSTEVAGTLTTPTIAKGGARSITVLVAVRPININYTETTRVLVEKSINNGSWTSVGSYNVITPKTLTVENFTIPVNDYSDNIKFRISRTSGKSIFLDRVVVNHSFVLSSSTETVCPNTPVVLTAQSSAPFNYTWSSTVGGNLVQNTGASVTANPSQNATYTAFGTYTNSFGTFTDTKIINVNTNVTPTATLTGGGTIDTEPGSVNLQVALTGTAPWSITYTANGANPQTITGITNSPFILTVSPEVDTNYQVTAVSDASCNGTGVGVSSVLVNKTVWRESNSVVGWSNGLPNATLNTYIFEPYVTGTKGSFIAKDLTINNNGLLTVSPNTVITASRYINGITSDRFVVESDANIMQSSNSENNGAITVKRISNMAKMHFTYWSAPVSGQNMYAFSDGGLVGGTPKNRFFIYSESTDLFDFYGINDAYSFRVGQGYAIRGKDSYNTNFNSPAPYTFTFTGIPNNGNLAFQNLKWTNAAHGYNLVGNPYPSNLDFDALYDANSSLIYGTAYFWTNQQYVPDQQGGNYSGSNYAIYNRSGGVPATFQDGVDSPVPTQYIKVGQGFLVQSMSGSHNQPLQFNNSMRSYSASSIFFNKQEVKSKDRYWLNLKSPSNINNTILVSYMPGATDGYERLYDADILVLGSDAFYTTNGTAKLAIQGRKYPLRADDVVTLGTKYFETGNYTIFLKEKEGIFDTDQAIYLKDKQLNKVINLSEEGQYTFAASKGTNDIRFEVIYQDILSFDSVNRSAGSVSVAKDEVDVVVRDTTNNITVIDVFDASGKLVQSVAGKSQKEVRINTSGLIKGVYILKITSDKGITTKKVIL
ncbi:T9SS type A sorting domain-containing protein [Epilithonimonas ginsengisoli]|uniref:T9SS type A sorting domain-containing protein n=1 Tax=Epilithonimonas ginsengisoli TaxID=1245592 RepID=A0ABU4JII7_9FLAO|nr:MULTISPECIES: T9SS type A sorting domain-containing protein [Chryseobacterium group]MBV6879070.1 T9SS type A sorting domain-containing protein [Epilithonimonas sp. FP105]MDW8549505.1 T9SS type A sorting domain-containing protein [Epilithonimonas ginsengisoli]OAH74369.1 hypothetical protein AXA65_06305 [Chryseobacterium sp. FP211-J200]